jgi:hypothetical protein
MSHDIADERYESIKRLITKIVRQFRQNHGGEYDLLLSDALFIYIKSARSWDPDKGPFAKRIAYDVWWGLFDRYREQQRKRANNPATVALTHDATRSPPFSLSNLLPDLSRNGRSLVVTALDLEGKDPSKLRLKLISTLLAADWSPERIAKAFREVRERL